ncbi:MAG: ABC transporter permease [Alphaproteobacteria bacterium]|nr:ABC transporter permease [Alphaproteobacteria bacterium]
MSASTRSSRGLASPWLALPAVAFLLVLFVLPIGSFLVGSVLDPDFTLRNFQRLEASRAFWIVLQNTIRISVTVTLVCFLVGYPMALRIATLRPAIAAAILLVVVLSVWISLLVRNYAWMVLLGREGIVSSALVALGYAAERRSLLYNEFSVVLAMTHVLLPFMVIPVVAALRAIDPALVRAGASLGAGAGTVVRRVVFPLSLPGVATGTVLVFVLALGFYVTPAVLGGRGQMMLAMMMESEVNEQLAWGYAGAHAAVLLVVTLLIFTAYNRRFGVDRLWGGHGK